MIWVPLKFKEKVVWEAMRGIPTVKWGNILVLPAWELFPVKPIVLDEIDDFEVEVSE